MRVTRGRGSESAYRKARKMCAEAFWLGRKGEQMTGILLEFSKIAVRTFPDTPPSNPIQRYWEKGFQRFTNKEN